MATLGTAASAAAAARASETATIIRVTCSPATSTSLADATREHVRDRDRVYEIDGAESRALATIGAFRVVAESDLHDIRDDSQNSRRSLKHLEKEGLIRHVAAQLR